MARGQCRRQQDLTETTIPPEVVSFWREGADRLRKRKAFEGKVASWERAILLNGGCCSTSTNPPGKP
jgi:pyridoxine/pyridoxamine 5'-phosphate oxidase